MARQAGQSEYEAWIAWITGRSQRTPDEEWINLDAADRSYWIDVEAENGRAPPPTHEMHLSGGTPR